MLHYYLAWKNISSKNIKKLNVIKGHFPIVKFSKLREPALFMPLTNIFQRAKQVPGNIPDIWDTLVNKQTKSLRSLGAYVLAWKVHEILTTLRNETGTKWRLGKESGQKD